jgi:hypothetical protein
MKLISPVETYHDTENGLVIANSQELTDGFWADVEAAKADFRIRLDGYTPVAQVPTAIWDKWIRQGIDVNHMTAKEIIARLKFEEMSKFVIAPNGTF